MHLFVPPACLSLLAGAYPACGDLPPVQGAFGGNPPGRRDLPGFTAPLTGIATVVVGVIFNLAVFFAWHSLWTRGRRIRCRRRALAALWKCRADIAKATGVCALPGSPIHA